MNGSYNLFMNLSTYPLILAFLLLVGGCRTKKVLVIDMPVDKDLLPSETKRKVKFIANLVEPKRSFENCSEVLRELELFFEFGLKGSLEKIETLKHAGSFESFSHYAHGYHILNLVAADSDADIFHIGLRPTILKEELNDLQKYLSRALPAEFNFISSHVKQLRPHIINISGSETIEENYDFFLENGYPPEEAKKIATKIYGMWNDFWKELIKSNPDITFNVSAGNGGRDWIGDELTFKSNETRLPTPANINLPNVKVIGSKNDYGLSSFSNYGQLVYQFEKGEGVAALIPCEGKLQPLKLTGTSQSTAIYTNKMSKE